MTGLESAVVRTLNEPEGGWCVDPGSTREGRHGHDHDAAGDGHAQILTPQSTWRPGLLSSGRTRQFGVQPDPDEDDRENDGERGVHG